MRVSVGCFLQTQPSAVHDGKSDCEVTSGQLCNCKQPVDSLGQILLKNNTKLGMLPCGLTHVTCKYITPVMPCYNVDGTSLISFQKGNQNICFKDIEKAFGRKEILSFKIYLWPASFVLQGSFLLQPSLTFYSLPKL